MDLACLQHSSINADHEGAVCGAIKTLYKDDVKIMALIMPCCSFNTSERCSCTYLLVETLQHDCYNCKCLLQACGKLVYGILCKVHTRPCISYELYNLNDGYIVK